MFCNAKIATLDYLITTYLMFNVLDGIKVRLILCIIITQLKYILCCEVYLYHINAPRLL